MNKRFKVKKELTDLRVEEQQVRAQVDKLGDETIAITPEDVEMMFVGKLAVRLVQNSVAASNIMKGLTKAYGAQLHGIEETLKNYKHSYDLDFARTKRKISNVAVKHPLAQKLCFIKGFTPYRLALIMAMVKDISKFNTPASLMTYCGLGVKHGHKVCKRNINIITQEEQKSGKETFGFNTRLSQQMYILGDSLIKLKDPGYFKHFYDKTKDRLQQRAINRGECEWWDVKRVKEEFKNVKDTKRKLPGYFMKNRTRQSLEAWSHSNAKSRMTRVLMHLLYTEWRTYKGLPARTPYPIEYLGHNHLITLDEVRVFEEFNYVRRDSHEPTESGLTETLEEFKKKQQNNK